MNSNHYQAVVIGAGGIGSAALLALARRGLRVLGIDRYAPPHDRGSSHGQSRIIRQAYFEHPDYVPLVNDAYRRWHALEKDAGRKLLHNCGLLEVGPADGIVVPGVLRAAQEHHLQVDQLSAEQIARRWPAFRLPAGLVGVYEPTAGYLDVEACVAEHLRAAASLGAEIAPNTAVDQWSAGEPITVHTDRGAVTAERLVLTAGPWAAELLSGISLELTIRHKGMVWFLAADDAARLPAYLFELPSGIFYGFPALADGTMKVAAHSGGVEVEGVLPEESTPPEQTEILAFTRQCLSAMAGDMLRSVSCYYTMSPDDHFVLDRWPDEPRVVFCAGLSGHGFKFAPTLGEALADLVVDGATELPVEFLGLERF